MRNIFGFIFFLATNQRNKSASRSWVHRFAVLNLILIGLAFSVGCSSNHPEFRSLSFESESSQTADPIGSQLKLQRAFSIVNGPVALNITSSSANIQWTLSNYGTGQVEYGLTSSYGQLSTPETSFNFQTHIQKISNLQAGMTYHYRVISKDSSGHLVTSADKIFTTLGTAPAPAPAPAGLVITSPSNGSTVASPVTITASVDDTICNGGLNHLEVLVNGTLAYSVAACQFSSPVSLPAGTSTILVRAIRWDNALMAQSSVSVTSASTEPACPTGSTVISSGSISAGISNTAAGGTLCLNGGSYSVASPISIGKAMTILGVNQPKITQTFNGVLFDIGASNVTLKGLTMTGANRNWGNDSCSGAVAVSASSVSNLTLADNYLTTFTCGFVLYGTDGFSITGNELHFIKYAAMTTYPGYNGLIDHNRIYDLNHDGPLGQNAYGITASGNRSRNITISNNLVQNAPTWECYDTHDGDTISFLNNTCVGPGRVGINAAYSGVAQVSNIRIEGNTINAGGLSSQWNSLVLTGSGTLMNNVVTGFGSCLFYSPNVTPSGNTCN